MAAVPAPKVRVRPPLIFNVTVALILLIVINEAPVPVNVTLAVPPILKELRLIEGTLDIIPAAVKLIITSSPGAGTVPPDQFAPTSQAPAPASAHVFVAADERLYIDTNNIIINAHFRTMLCLILLGLLSPS